MAVMCAVVVASALPVASSQAASGAPGAPRELRAGGLDHPIGLDPADVQFAWHVGDDRRGARQRAYRIVVSRPPPVGSGAAPVVWDSGRVTSPDQSAVPYGGPALASNTLYRWTVQTWAASGGPGPLAPAATFE